MHVKVQRMLEKPIAPVYLITGPSVLVERAIAALEAVLEPLCAPASFNRARWRPGEGDGAGVLAAARTPPMLAARRVIRVDALHEAPDAWLEQLVAYVGGACPTTTVVVAGRGFPKVQKGGRNWSVALTKAVEAVGLVLKFGDEDADPARFVLEEVRRLGGNIAPSEARMVVDLVGPDLSWLEREVEKLVLAVEVGAPIDAATVAACCVSVAEPVVWDLTTAIAARRVGPALAALRRLLDDGEAPHKLLALVVWQMRLVLRMADMLRHGSSEEEVRSALRMRSDLFSALRRDLERSAPGAAAMLASLARANRQMNRAKAGDDRILESLVLQLATR